MEETNGTFVEHVPFSNQGLYSSRTVPQAERLSSPWSTAIAKQAGGDYANMAPRVEWPGPPKTGR